MAAAIGLLAVAMRFEVERKGSGIGAVLDTKRKLAEAVVKQLEAQLDAAFNGIQRGTAVEELQMRLSHARERLEAASRTSDAVVIAKLHVQGAALRSGRITSGDILLAVDDRPVGADVDLAGRLIRGEMHTRVTITVRKTDGSQDRGTTTTKEVVTYWMCWYQDTVQLQRAYISGHPTNEAPASILGF